jgi:hypothetical protein
MRVHASLSITNYAALMRRAMAVKRVDLVMAVARETANTRAIPAPSDQNRSECRGSGLSQRREVNRRLYYTQHIVSSLWFGPLCPPSRPTPHY